MISVDEFRQLYKIGDYVLIDPEFEKNQGRYAPNILPLMKSIAKLGKPVRIADVSTWSHRFYAAGWWWSVEWIVNPVEPHSALTFDELF